MRLFSGLLLSTCLLILATSAQATSVMSAQQQQCTSNAECTLVSLTCGNGCASVPVNTASKTALEPGLRQQCGGQLPEESEVVCHMNPPMQSVCMNNRCTVDYAFDNNASSGDYQTSPAPTAATQASVTQNQ